MSMIQVTNLTFAYDGSYDTIFENVSFQLDTNWRLGFTGRNGRGKMTFLKLLLGQYEYSGSISASVDFDYFPYQIKDDTRLTSAIIEELCPEAEEWQVLRELSLLQVDETVLERSFNTLSNGEQCKVMLASMFLKENNFMLIDEPTNHLDAEGRASVSQYLKRKRGYILVSHDRAFLDDCVDHILSINKTNIEIQKGNFSSWWSNKQLQDQYELAENEKLKHDIKRLNEASKQTNHWSHEVEKTKNGSHNSGSKVDRGYVSHKAAKMMKRSKVLEKRQQNAIEEKSKLLKNVESSVPMKMTPLVYHKHQLVELNCVSIHYGEKQVTHDISFSIEQGDRIVITGKNGSGKSSLLKLIYGEPLSYSGTLQIASQLRMSYVSQQTAHLQGNLKDYARNEGSDEALFKSLLRKLDFSRDQFEKDMKHFSGGQKKKVLIAKSICEPAHLYIWDEPLNFIDVLSRMQIEEVLLDYEPTLLFVEHDRVFSDKIATKHVELDS